MTPDEFLLARRLIAAIASARPRRASRRRRRDTRGDRLDMRRLIRQSLRTGGDPVMRPVRARKDVPRKLVVLCDVSGSMDSYARALLLFLHATRRFRARRRGVRVRHDADPPHRRAASRDPRPRSSAAAPPCTTGGAARASGPRSPQFNDTYGRRALSRGAVVLIVSDGWEREGSELVAREMARLSRAAYALVWVNPLKGDPRYQPLAGGMRAALPVHRPLRLGTQRAEPRDARRVLAGISRRHAPATVWPGAEVR